ncbi:MAG: Hcp family type VI secretion system effector [Verrucomicrobiaceae bacterium]
MAASLVGSDLEAAAYIKFDGVDGEATSPGGDGFIKIEYYKIEIDRSGPNGAAAFKNVVVALPMEKASPNLMLSCATGAVLKNATLYVTRTGSDGTENTFLKIEFTKVVIDSYRTTGDGGDDRPVDEVTLGYTEVEWTYNVRDAGGKVIEVIKTPTLSTVPR